MLRWLTALVFGFSLCFCSPAIWAGDGDGEVREDNREVKSDDAKRDKREQRVRERRKKQQDRKPKKTRPQAGSNKPKPPVDEKPKEEQPAPPRPEKADPKPSEPTSGEKPTEPLPKPAEKQEAKKPEAAPAEQTDADFLLQGEYLGHLISGPLAGKVGVQVVALGDGKFEAYLLQGGLPGNDWLRGSDRSKLTGQRDGARLILRDGDRSIELDGTIAKVSDAQGHALGELKKVLRRSPTMGAAPAMGATVLFNGSSTEAFKSAKLTDDGLLGVGALTKEPVGDFRMHLEFRTPFEPKKRGQGRGNSGIYIQERYEVQVLDSFGLAGDFNECGALYRQRKPDYNLCLPPMSWQTYDIYFTAARFDAQGNKSANARITVFHNGIAVQDNVELTGKTGAGQKEEPTERPIRFQDHSNAVVYRNIWIVPGQGRGAVIEQRCCE